MRIPLMIIDIDKGIKLAKRLSKISAFFYSKKLRDYLRKAHLKIKLIDYINVILLNAIIYFLLFGSLFSLLFYSQERTVLSLINGLLVGLLMSIIILVILYIYPKIIANKIGEAVDSELLFALQDMLVQIKANVNLYKAMINVIENNYLFVKDEFQMVVDDVERGDSMINALKNLALRTNSNFMKRTAWQLMNSIKSGSNSIKVIESLINELNTYYHSLIKNYTKELNVLTLIYLTLAVVAPTIGITVMIILSSFGGLVLTQGLLIGIIAFLSLLQPILVGLINSRRPLIKI